jgi:hypothetical protein
VPTNPQGDLALKVLVCDRDTASAGLLLHELGNFADVAQVQLAESISDAVAHLRDGGWNTAVFIDPLTMGLDEATDFIFNVRDTLPHIAFVLFIDRTAAERHGPEFYSGRRARFLHYFSVDKHGPIAAFRSDVAAALEKCAQYLIPWVTLQQITDIREHATSLAASASGPMEAAISSLTSRIDALLERLPGDQSGAKPIPNSVFVSCRFAEIHYIDGLKALLADAGFEVTTGDNADGYISQAILERIREAEFFICMMTRDEQKTDGTYTTSPWLLEEKGAALAFGKYIVLLVEEGVTGYGGLQGDWQRHHFAAKGFTSAALKAVKQLQSASGHGGSQST